MVLQIGIVAIGVSDVDQAARFWSEALDYHVRRDGFGGWSIVLESHDGAGTRLALQSSESPPDKYPRLHLDLHVANAAEQAVEVERLISLGAERVEWDRYPDDPDFVVLADLDGNRFCIVDLNHEYR
jgi:catechol 2,3-dioxygenase-like lactoylglutathione lyase family enzyme